jgi:hypothetical protein
MFSGRVKGGLSGVIQVHEERLGVLRMDLRDSPADVGSRIAGDLSRTAGSGPTCPVERLVSPVKRMLGYRRRPIGLSCVLDHMRCHFLRNPH